MIKRIIVLIVAFGLLSAPLQAEDQKSNKAARIGWLGNTYGLDKVFLDELSKLGWVKGKNFVMEYRSAGKEFKRLPALAEELVRLKVDVFVTVHTVDTHAAKNATTSIPIVFTIVSDPVGDGFIKTHARPGGNLTGVNTDYIEIMGKGLQLLKEAVPEASRVAYLWNPAHGRLALRGLEKMEAASKRLGLKLQSLEVRDPKDFEPAFSAMTREHANALFVLPGPLTNSNMKRIADLALRHRLPMATNGAVNWATRFGALMAYTIDLLPVYRRVAHFVDKILKGAKPADLPVEMQTHYKFAINLKTTKALDITIPQSLLIQATEVIE